MIDLKYYAKVFTNRQLETVLENLTAYLHNYGYLRIMKEDYGSGFYLYTDEKRFESGSWTQFCYNIDYLNGWLYGAVQAVNGIMKPLPEKDYEEDLL